MFIQQLSQKQQSVFLSIAKNLMAADGDIASAEKTLLNFYRSQMPENVIAIDYEEHSLASVFDTHKAKMAIMFELVGLGHADGYYDSSEKAFIHKLAKAIGLNESHVSKCESWVEKQLKLINEANKMMEA